MIIALPGCRRVDRDLAAMPVGDADYRAGLCVEPGKRVVVREIDSMGRPIGAGIRLGWQPERFCRPSAPVPAVCSLGGSGLEIGHPAVGGFRSDDRWDLCGLADSVPWRRNSLGGGGAPLLLSRYGAPTLRAGVFSSHRDCRSDGDPPEPGSLPFIFIHLRRE